MVSGVGFCELIALAPLLRAYGFGYEVRPDLDRSPSKDCEGPERAGDNPKKNAGDVAEWLKATVC